jgi:hypothetical protein
VERAVRGGRGLISGATRLMLMRVPFVARAVLAPSITDHFTLPDA